MDLEKLDSIKTYIVENKPDIVINCTAFTDVDGAEDNKELARKINADSVLEIVKGCNAVRATLIHFSTDYVFDGGSLKPYSESSKTNPLSIYGKTKLMGDINIVRHCSNYLIFRISWIYGAHNKNFLKAIYKRIINGDSLSVVDDQVGSPTPSELVAKTVINVIENYDLKHQKELLNLQPKGAVTWFGFANFINNILDYSKISQEEISPVSSAEFNAKALRPRYSLLNTNKIERLFQIKFNSWEDYAVEAIKNLEQKD